ncbi:putative Cystatin domain-containing protein [Helianthus annuus]|nr:putative Cystatin domain-containing protein [Helianthus annuus]
MANLSTLTFAIVIVISCFVANGMLGARTKVDHVKTNKMIQEIGRYSVEEYNRLPRSTTANGEGGLRFSRVVEAEQQVVSGMKYYMKIEALTKSGDPKVFESVVVVKPWLRSKQLVKFGPSQAVLRPVW